MTREKKDSGPANGQPANEAMEIEGKVDSRTRTPGNYESLMSPEKFVISSDLIV